MAKSILITLLTILFSAFIVEQSSAQCIVTSTTDGTTCKGQAGSVNATANGSNKIYWYTHITGGTLLDSGDTYTIPNAQTTATYYAEAAGGGGVTPDSINTLTPNNGQAGAYFDCKPKKNVTVTGFNFVPRGTASNFVVRVYFKNGTHVGNETNSSVWTLLGTSNSFSATANVLTNIPLTLNQPLVANQTYAFYVVTTSGSTLGYTNGTSLGAVAVQNSDMIIYQGRGSGGLFSSSLFTTRTFAGTMRYEIGSVCTSARTGVILTVHPEVAVDSQTIIDSSCQDFSTSLHVKSLSPISSYQWQIYNSTSGQYVNIAPPFVNNGDILNVTSADDTLNGAKIRCILAGPCGRDTSADMTMVVVPKPSVVKHPTDINAIQGDNVVFEVDAVGVGVQYQWQVGVNGVFANINNSSIYQGVKTNRLLVRKVAQAQNEFQFRCRVSGDKSFCNADPDTSNIGVLYVDPPVSVSNITSNGKKASIYPNPTSSNQVIIKSEINSISNYVILDKLGRAVQKGSITPDSENQIDITKLSASVYIVQLSNNNGDVLETLRFTRL